MPEVELRQRTLLADNNIQLVTLLSYAETVPCIMRVAKYVPHPHLLSALGKLFAHYLQTSSAGAPMISANSLILAAPSHPKLLKRRGLNPARVIAAPIAAALKGTLYEPFCRVAYRAPQAQLPRAQRRSIPKGIIRCHPLPQQEAIIVDDVVTSGSTIERLARIAQDAGATKVTALVLCDARR